MRLAFLAGAAVLIAASFSGDHARAQGAPGAVLPGQTETPCGNLPPEAARTVPAPFDSYMRLLCRDPVGQGLVPVKGFRWTAPGGQPIGLLAMSAPGADGPGRFPAGWYVELSPVELSPTEQRRLKLDFKRAIRPRFLDKATVLELRARTSSGETKLVFLVVPDTEPRKPASLIGLECNGACFREDTQPLMFEGSAG